MTEALLATLADRFTANATEWRRLGDAAALDAFLAECGVAGPQTSQACVHLGDDGIGFTLADGLVAETGSLLLSGRIPESRRVAFLSEVHYALVAEENCYATIGDFFALGATDSSTWRNRVGHQLTMISGPSRTADIEKTLVLGAHGTKRLVLGTAPTRLLRDRYPGSLATEESK